MNGLNQPEMTDMDRRENQKYGCDPDPYKEISAQDYMLREIIEYPMLKPEEELHLGAMLRDGTDKERRDAIEKLVLSNRRYVVKIARKYSYVSGMQLEDLIQEGTLGLAEAARRYDVQHVKFCTYATWWIKQYIQRSIMNTGSTIRYPVHIQEKLLALKKLRKQASMEGRSVTEQEVTECLELTLENARILMAISPQTVSLDMKVGDSKDEPDTSLIDLIADTESGTVEENAEQSEMQNAIRQALGCLSFRDQKIIRMRFGLDGQEPCTLGIIANEVGLTRERVRQIVVKNLKLLRRKHGELKYFL